MNMRTSVAISAGRGRVEDRPAAQWSVRDVLDRTDLATLLDETTRLSNRAGPGRRWHCPVPEHDDSNASVSMFRDRSGHERWRCWSAGHRGDAVDLAVIATGRDRAGAIEWLAGRAGLHPDLPLMPLPPRPEPVVAEVASVMSPLVSQYVRVCESVLRGAQGKPMRDWLHARGIDDDTIRLNHLGADLGRDVMLRRRGLPHGDAPAVTFPVFDETGRLTYVQARYLDPTVAGRKYDNPSASLAPHPRLAFPVAPSEETRGGTLLVCEGIPDALIAAQAGFPSVALLGATIPDSRVAGRIASYAHEHRLGVAVVGDGDTAGRDLNAALVSQLAAIGVGAGVVEPPDGLDLNAWALSDPGWIDQVDWQLGIDLGIER